MRQLQACIALGTKVHLDQAIPAMNKNIMTEMVNDNGGRRGSQSWMAKIDKLEAILRRKNPS